LKPSPRIYPKLFTRPAFIALRSRFIASNKAHQTSNTPCSSLVMAWFSSHHRSSSSRYSRRPRDGYIQRVMHRLRKMWREFIHWAKHNPVKFFMLVLMPLITGGALSTVMKQFGVNLPEEIFGGGRGKIIPTKDLAFRIDSYHRLTRRTRRAWKFRRRRNSKLDSSRANVCLINEIYLDGRYQAFQQTGRLALFAG
jgi:hypothetical protein